MLESPQAMARGSGLHSSYQPRCTYYIGDKYFKRLLDARSGHICRKTPSKEDEEPEGHDEKRYSAVVVLNP